MDFYFVRHGESTNNTLFANEYPNDRPGFEKVRKANPDLTDQGRAQAELVGLFLNKVFVTGEAQLSEAPAAAGAPSTWTTTPNGIYEIWSSYLARAIETGIAIQHGINGGPPEVIPNSIMQPPLKRGTPPMILNEGLTEVGGHYQYDETSNGMVATPGYSNKDVLTRWGKVAWWGDMPPRNNEGWNRREKRETPGEGRERALAAIRHIESIVLADTFAKLAAVDDESGEGGNSATVGPKNIVVITHGDFFKMLLTRLSQVGMKDPADPSKAPLDVGTVSVEGLAGERQMMPTIRHLTRTACPRLHAAANMKVRNTSINHLRVEFDKTTRAMRWSSRFLDCMDHLDGSEVAALQVLPSLV